MRDLNELCTDIEIIDNKMNSFFGIYAIQNSKATIRINIEYKRNVLKKADKQP